MNDERIIYACTHCGQEYEREPDRCGGCGGKTVGPYGKDDLWVDFEQRTPQR